jgi:hypothetical protein
MIVASQWLNWLMGQRVEDRKVMLTFKGNINGIYQNTLRSCSLKGSRHIFSAWKSWEGRDIHFECSYRRNIKVLSHFAKMRLTGPNQRCLTQASIQVDFRGFWRQCIIPGITGFFVLCSSSSILKKTAFRELYWFPSSGVVAGETYSVGSLRMWGQKQSSSRNVVFYGILDDG